MSYGNLDKRFRDLHIVSLFDILDPSIPVDDCARRLHGVDELSELVEMYGTDKTENQRTYPAIIDGLKAKARMGYVQGRLVDKGDVRKRY